LGRVKKGVTCSIEGCNEAAVHSLSSEDIKVLKDEGLKVKDEGRRIYLCEKHYKIYKKARRRIDRLLRWRFR